MALQPVQWTHPYETTLNIFKNLGLHDLCRAAQVCQAWRAVAKDKSLWPEVFRQIRGAATLPSPTAYIRITNANVLRLFAQHAMTLSIRELSIFSLRDGDDVNVTLPFDLEQLVWVSESQAGLVGQNQVALLDVPNGQLVCTHQREDAISLQERFVLFKAPGGLLLKEHGTEHEIKLDLDGDYIDSEAAGDFLVVVNERGDQQRITLYNWKSGEKLYTSIATSIAAFEAFANGNILLELEEPPELGGSFSGLYIHKTGTVRPKPGKLRIDYEELPRRMRDYYLIFSIKGDAVTAYSMRDGKAVLTVPSQSEVLCAVVWKDRMIVYTDNNFLHIYDLESKRRIFAERILLEPTVGDSCEMDNISFDVMAIRSQNTIVLIDILHGRILQEIDSPEPSDLYFDGSILREVRRSDNFIIERKFF